VAQQVRQYLKRAALHVHRQASHAQLETSLVEFGAAEAVAEGCSSHKKTLKAAARFIDPSGRKRRVMDPLSMR